MEIRKVIDEMTIKEKVLLLESKDIWHLNGVERLGVPSITLTDGPNGLRLTVDMTAGITEPATAVPTESAVAAAWNVELAEALGGMIAEECQFYNVGILLGPGVNGKRSPLGGRNFEYYSEDPLLSGKLGAAFIRGVQSKGIGTSLKHFVANDQETRRFNLNVNMDERTFREIYLRPFEIAIREGKPWTIMGAYPKLRGEHLCENEYALKTILRDEFQYDGVALSDWSATVHKANSHKNGLDLETGSNGRSGELLAAVEDGEISIGELDEHVERVLTLIDKIVAGKYTVSFDWSDHHRLARRVAEESVVLLKNQENILPLSKSAKVAVIGKFAKAPHFKGGGSSATNPKCMDIPYDCICNLSSAVYADGYDDAQTDETLLDEACAAAKGKDAVIVFIGTTETIESEGSDRKNILLPEGHIRLVNALAEVNKNIIIVNSSGSAVEFRQIEPAAKAILQAWLLGESGGGAIADILFGNVNPSGKLSETFPVMLENTPAYPYFPGYRDDVFYNEELLVGYRYYDTKKVTPQYPFGFGLSYTTFSYSNLRLSKEKLRNGDKLQVSVDITNTGHLFGKETVEFYVHDRESYLIRPAKELKGFCKVGLNPGETKTVSIELDDSAFAYFVPHLNCFAVESGLFDIMAGPSSAETDCSVPIEFQSKDDVRLPLTDKNIVEEFLNDDRYAQVTRQMLDIFGFDEATEMFPIICGITIESLPAFFRFISIPEELSNVLRDCILKKIPVPDEIIAALQSEVK